jgi:AraC family transcriptional regulator
MIIRELPEATKIKNSPRANRENEIIWASTKEKYQYPNHTTPYLFIANFIDTGHYQLNSRHISINEKLFYFLNAGDNLEINFKDQTPLETLFVLFKEEFVKSWINYKHTDTDSLLTNGAVSTAPGWNIPSIPFEYSSTIINQLNSIKSYVERKELDAILFELLESFWDLKERVGNNMDRIAAKRKSTREEIYRRLLTAKIFIHDHISGMPTIAEIAAEACLDKFHFLKLFKGFYGITPHQYLVKLKLERAFALLATGRFTVMEVCQSVGFESQGTFTNLFKKYYHLLPSDVSKLPQNPLPS